MPGTPLRSGADAMPAMVSMSFAVASSGAEAGVMTPSPLKRVSAKIFTLSAVSSMEIASFLSPKLLRIWRADAWSRAPTGSSALNSSRDRASFSCRSTSAFFRMEVSHWAVAITSSTRMFPSPSTSMYLRAWASNSRFLTGQLSTVHILRSSSPRWRMSSPLLIFTRTVPPTEVKVQGYVFSEGLLIIFLFWFSGTNISVTTNIRKNFVPCQKFSTFALPILRRE